MENENWFLRGGIWTDFVCLGLIFQNKHPDAGKSLIYPETKAYFSPPRKSVSTLAKGVSDRQVSGLRSERTQKSGP